MSEFAERALVRQGNKTYLTHARWQLWFNRLGRLMGVAIVHPASDYALELRPNGLTEEDRILYCEQLCDTLNKSEGRIT